MKNSNQTLQKILEKSMEMAESTGQFIVEQGGELLEQFFLWHTARHSIGILLAFAILFFSFRIIRLFSSKEKEDWHTEIMGRYYEEDHAAFFAWTIIIIGSIVSLIIFLVNFYHLVYILTAPKLYLIDYFFKAS